MEKTVIQTEVEASINNVIAAKGSDGNIALEGASKATLAKCNASKQEVIQKKEEKKKLLITIDERKTTLLMLEKERTEAMESGDADTTKSEIATEDTSKLLREVEEELSTVDKTLATLEEEQKKVCNDANEAETKEAAQEGKVASEKITKENFHTVAEATKIGLKRKKQEATRAKERALEIARELKRRTKELSIRRKGREASEDGGCQTLGSKVEEAEVAIAEWKKK